MPIENGNPQIPGNKHQFLLHHYLNKSCQQLHISWESFSRVTLSRSCSLDDWPATSLQYLVIVAVTITNFLPFSHMLIIFSCSAEFSSLFYDVLLLNVNRKFALQTNYYNLPHGCTLFQYYLSSMICTLISISLPLCSLSLCSPLHPSVCFSLCFSPVFSVP